MIALKATELPALALIAAALVTHVLIDVRFAHLLDGVIAAPHAVTFATCVGAAALSRVGSPRTRAWRYWLLTFTVAVYLAACHATGIICAYLNPHLRLVLPLHSLRCIGATACVSHFAGLKPLKSWVLVLVGIAPLVVLQPVALAVPQSWEARNSLTFWGLYAVETPVCLGIAFLVLFFSYTGQAAIRSARVLSAELAVQAAQTQALLEAAMPPAVARALLDDKPAADLTCSYPSATIAFVELDDFSDKVGGSPTELLQWLDHVYVAFDALVDAYGERVNKIEVVANTYVLSAGLPVPNPGHTLAMCAFCVDLLALCRDVPGVGPVRVRIGLHSGPVIAGVVGGSRRFYRVFGDTVNVASRMMSTGASGRVQVSLAVAEALALIPPSISSALKGHVPATVTGPEQATGAAGGFSASTVAGPVSDRKSTLRGTADATASSATFDPPSLVLLPPTLITLEYRGSVVIKGKGHMQTFWLANEPASSASCAALPSQAADTAATIAGPTAGLPFSSIAAVVIVEPTEADDCGLEPVIPAAGANCVRQGAPESRVPASQSQAVPQSTQAAVGVEIGELVSTRDLGELRIRRPVPRAAEHLKLPESAPSVVLNATRSSPGLGVVLSGSGNGATPLQVLGLGNRSSPVLQASPTSSIALVTGRQALGVSGNNSGNNEPGPLAMRYLHKALHGPSIASGARFLSARAVVAPVAERADRRAGTAGPVLPKYPPRTAMASGPAGAGRVPVPAVSVVVAPRYDDAETPYSGFSARTPDGTCASPASPPAHRDEDVLGAFPSPGHETSELGIDLVGNAKTRFRPAFAAAPVDAASAAVPPSREIEDLYVTSLGKQSLRVQATRPPLSPTLLNESSFTRSESLRGHDRRIQHGHLAASESRATVAVSVLSSRPRRAEPTPLVPVSIHERIASSRSSAAASLVVHPLQLAADDPDRVLHAHLGGDSCDAPTERHPPPSASPPSQAARFGARSSAATPVGEFYASANDRPTLEASTTDGPCSMRAWLHLAMTPARAIAVPHFVDPAAESEVVQRLDVQLVSNVASSCETPCEVQHPTRRSIALTTLMSSLLLLQLGGVFCLISAQGGVGLAIAVAHLIEAGASIAHTSAPISALGAFPVALVVLGAAWAMRSRAPSSETGYTAWIATCASVLLVFEYASCAALALSPPACDDEYCISSTTSINIIAAEQRMLWLALLFGALGVSILYARLPLVHAFVCLAAIVLLDAVVVAVRATQLQAPPDVAVIAFAAMLTSHIAAALAARSHEESIRAAFALQCALRSAAADARRLLDDLFPPTAVRALLAGHLVPPRVADCAAVLFCDLAGFTRLASSLSPREVMRTADAIFSAFDGLVQEASEADGELWKVDTAGDAYIVVGGVGTGYESSDSSSLGHSSSAAAPSLVAQQRSLVRARALLDRMFVLAHAMQAAMSRLRAELGLPLHARIGIHCGPVVSGIVGSQRPRFCVLGPALLDAEAVEAASSPDGVSCTGAAQRVYLSSTFTFVERAPHSGGVAPRAQQHSRTPQPTPPLQGAVTLLPGCDAPEPAAGAAAQLKLSPRGVGGLFDVAPPLSPSLLLCRVLSP